MKNWSTYQLAVFDNVANGTGHTVVNAVAGSGKTTSLIEALGHVPTGCKTLFVAFNKSIATELARRAPRGVEVSTLHSYGLKTVTSGLGRLRIDANRVDDFCRAMHGDDWKTIDLRRDLAKTVSLAKGALASTEEAIDALIDEFGIDSATNGHRASFIGDVLKLLGQCRSTEDGRIDFDDMIWLPVMLDLPQRKFDRVFVDETQDLNAAQIELTLRACMAGGRILAVGDPRQCHPAGTLVEVEAGRSVPIESLSDGGRVRGWNRNAQKMVGGRRVQIASRRYDGKVQRVVASDRAVVTTPNHRYMCRWTDRSTNACVTYLMWRAGYGFRVGWCQLFANTSDNSRVFHLAHRARLEGADKTWVLRVHESRTDASVYESIVAARYGIPTATFEPVDGAQHMTRAALDSIFSAVQDENFERGARALVDHDREFEYPIYPWPGRKTTDLQGRRTYFEVYSANLLPHLMSLPLPDAPNAWVSLDEVQVRSYAGDVYSLDVEEDHSYSANGLVVLNCIYAFRGADENAFSNVKERLRATELPLSVCYRCCRAVVREAQTIVPTIEPAPAAEEGEVRHASFEEMRRAAGAGDFILSRTNAPLISLCMTFLAEERRANIQGRDVGKQLAGFVKKAKTGSVESLRSYVEEWASKECVRLAKKRRGTQAIEDRAACILALSEGAASVADVVERIESLFADSDDASRITLSTTHKAKGLERDRVWMLDATYRRRPGAEEENLAYVAISRARKILIVVDDLGRDE